MIRTAAIYLILFFVSSSASSAVNTKNGNFYLSYTDLIVEVGGGGEFEITRTYNSKSNDRGLFGYGWNSDIESFIIVSASGTPVQHANGSGKIYYTTPLQSEGKYAEILSKNIDDIVRERQVDLAKSKNESDLQSSIADFRRKLESDQQYRHSYWRKYLREERLFETPIPIGYQFEATCSCSFKRTLITKTINGYRLERGAATEYYDEDGKIIRIRNADGTLDIIRSARSAGSDEIVQLQFEDQVVNVFMDQNGRIKNLLHKDSSGTLSTTSYSYDKRGDLIFSKDVEDNIFRYSYDALHNMTAVKYVDDTALELKYQDTTSYVESVRKRDGSLTEYYYDGNDDFNYWTEIRQFSSEQAAKNYQKLHPNLAYRERKEWIIRNNSDGSQRIVEINIGTGYVEGDKFEVTRELSFDELGRLSDALTFTSLYPTGTRTSFQWDDQGRLIERRNQDWVETFDYDSIGTLNASNYILARGGAETRLHYEYADGRVVSIEGPSVSISLEYFDDNSNKIKAIRLGDRLLNFSRSETGDPISMSLEYDGEIQRIDIILGENGSVRASGDIRAKSTATTLMQGLLRVLDPIGQKIEVF